MKNEKDIRARLAELDSERAMLVKSLRPTATKSALPALRVPLWTLIQGFLEQRGGKASVSEITDTMVAAGHQLGKYPRRNVKICVTSPKMSQVFAVQAKTVKGETVEIVTLKTPMSRLNYRPQFRNQQTEPSEGALTH